MLTDVAFIKFPSGSSLPRYRPFISVATEVEAAQNQIQNEQLQLQQTAEKLNAEFNIEQERINQEARDSIQAFLKDYNKTRKYDFVMVKAGDNLLIANPKYDITADVVKGLNKRYKK